MHWSFFLCKETVSLLARSSIYRVETPLESTQAEELVVLLYGRLTGNIGLQIVVI